MRIAAVVVAGCLLVLAVQTHDTRSPSDLFERARLLDESNSELREAIRLYTAVIRHADAGRPLKARAQYRVGILHERLGHEAEAQRAFRAVVNDYPEQTAQVRKARERIHDATDSREPEPLLRKSGPSPDGTYRETFTFSAPAILMMQLDTIRRRLYVVASSYRRSPENPARTEFDPSQLVAIDIDKEVVIRTMSLEAYVAGVALHPASGAIYVTAQSDGAVRVIDAATFAQSDIPVPGRPTGVAIDAATNKVYVTSQGFGGNDKLFVIDGTVVNGPHDLGGVGGDLLVNPVTHRIYAKGNQNTRVFDGTDLTVLEELPEVGAVEIHPAGDRLFVMATDDTLRLLDARSHQVLASFDAPSGLRRVALDRDTGILYAALGRSDQLAAFEVSGTGLRFSLPSSPSGLALDAATGDIWIAHDGKVSGIGVLPGRQVDVALPEEFTDDLDGPSLDGAWSIVSRWGTHSITERPGHLRVRVSGRRGSAPRPLLVKAFRGDAWDLETRCSYATGRTGGLRDLSFAVHFGIGPGATRSAPSSGELSPSLVRIQRTREDWDGCCPGRILVTFVEHGKLAQSVFLSPAPADAYAWRIRRRERTITVERSDDGMTFAAVASHTFGALIDGTAQAIAIRIDSFQNEDAYADFDSVRLRRAP